MSERILEVSDLAVAFHGKRVVEDVSFHIERGETLALVGESGSGKTVTALSIPQLLPYPQASHPQGSIRLDGVEMVVGPSIEPSRVTVNPFNIGGSGVFDAGGNWFNGEIDDVAVWDVALEPDDIMLIATGGLTPLGGRPGPDPVPPVVRITVGIQGAAFAVTATGMAPTRSYILRRSVDGQVFTNVGTPFTGNSDHVFIDLTPLAGIALYQIWEVTP